MILSIVSILFAGYMASCSRVSFYINSNLILLFIGKTEMEFKEFEPRFKSAKTRFKFSAGLNLETFDTILSGTNHI